MNKYEQRAAEQRQTTLGSSITLWSALAALIVVVLLILGLNSSASSDFYRIGAAVAAVVLLILRQIARRSRGKTPQAAQPDPQSRLNLQ
jgi:hypothetical protein